MPKEAPAESPTEGQETAAADGQVAGTEVVTDGAGPATVEGAQPDANAAESSAADSEDAKAKGEPSLLDVLTDVVKKPAPEESSASEQKTDDGKTEAEAEAAKDTEGKDGEEEQPPFHTHPAWKRKQAQVEELRGEVDRYKGPAEQFDRIVAFATENTLTANDMADGMLLTASFKNDPKTFLEHIAPYVASAQERLGEKLPEDLQAKVDTGAVDEETAKELALARHRMTASETRIKAQDEESAADRQTRIRAEMQTAVGNWERSIVDPDYQALRADVSDQMTVIAARDKRMPTTPEEAVALAKDALKEVKAKVARYRPKPAAVQTTPSSSAPATRSEPTSILEAAHLGLERARSRAA